MSSKKQSTQSPPGNTSSALPSQVDVLVVGSGPTGLGACCRLEQHGHQDWAMVDLFPQPSGLACTDETDEGFLFDMGGHVIFSHFQWFDDLIEEAVGKGEAVWNELQRVCYVWLKERWVPYPFQNNLYCLPQEDKIKCINGVIDATKASAAARAGERPVNFDEWILKVMGEGIAELFMRPYNFKVWAYPTTHLQCEWLGERVATVDAKKVIQNVILNKPSEGWGPNAVFRFPKEGGTGNIWKKVAAMLPQEKCYYSRTMTGIDFDNKMAVFADGSKVKYNKMLNTSPLDITLQWMGRGDMAKNLNYSSTHVIGLGLRGVNPHDLKCWLYYPEDNCPFYRCTVFSLYADKNCPSADEALPTLKMGDQRPVSDTTPKKGPYWSLMFEVSESIHKPVDVQTIVAETIQGALNTHMISADSEIVSIYHRRLERGYPTPHLNRESVVTEALPLLRDKDVWNRGRFGSWRYEVGNQDHSCLLGVEAVDNMLFGTQEMCLNYPNLVNPKKNMQLRYTRR